MEVKPHRSTQAAEKRGWTTQRYFCLLFLAFVVVRMPTERRYRRRHYRGKEPGSTDCESWR
jgi:hypothetical protein